MKKYKKLNLRKLSIAKLKENFSIMGGTEQRTDKCLGTKTRTMCGNPCGGELSIDNFPGCRE